jgi:hypothetical protein
MGNFYGLGVGSLYFQPGALVLVKDAYPIRFVFEVVRLRISGNTPLLLVKPESLVLVNKGLVNLIAPDFMCCKNS